jgi:hypothetical protein
VYCEVASGEHVEVWVDWVVVECDEVVCPWSGSVRGKDGAGSRDEAVVEGCECGGAGGCRSDCVVVLEA